MSQLRSKRSDLLGAFFAGLTVVSFCLLLLWHDPLVFWNDDYELSILPVFADVARSWSEGYLPLLSPYSWVCGNLAGEFQYGTFSVFVNAAVVLIWKFPLTFPEQAAALSITHLFVLASGAFLLARDRKLCLPSSLFVALVAALNGWIVCWGATDWFGALGAFTWLPWAWWGLERALDRRRSRWRFLWPAPFVYLVVTGGFPYTVLMLALLIAWLACRAVALRGGGSIEPAGQSQSLTSILPMFVGVALGFGLSAPAWLALFDYVRGSARVTQTTLAHWQWIVPWRALPAFVLPGWTVNWTDFSTRQLSHIGTELACGLVAPAALIAGFIWRPRMLMRRLGWELILLIVLLLLCMLPTAGVFRWSFRWLPFLHLVLAICAAEVLRLRPGSPTASASVLLLVAVTIPMAIFNTAGNYGVALMLIYFQIAVVWAVGEWFLPDFKFRECAPAVVTFAILLATYICIPTNCGVPKYNFSQELTKPAPLDRQRLYLAVYSPAEFAYRREYRSGPAGQVARPGNTPMWAQLHFIDGYSPILSAGVAREFKFFTHGEIDGDFGKYLVENQSTSGGILEKLGVDGIVVAQEIHVDPSSSEWRLVFANEEGRVFHRNDGPFPRVRSVNWIDSRPAEKFVKASISQINDSRNNVVVDVDVPEGDRPALLTFSRPYFRGYDGRMGGQKLIVDSYRGLFPVVEVPAGSHGRLTLSYRPRWLIYGGAVAFASCAVFAIGLVAAARDFSARLLNSRG